MKLHTGLLAVLGLLTGAATTALAAPVTFQVNMSAQTSLGNFNPATDGVFVAGDPLNGWSTTDSPLDPSPGNTNIYVGTFDVTGTAGGTAQYKFLFTTAAGSTWEGNVGAGGGNGNRTFTISDTDQTLPVVYFNNVTSSTTIDSDVTFQVNMSVQISQGAFDPDAGTVNVAGEFNAWNTSDFALTRSGTDTNLWVGNRTLSGAVNSAVQYKFVMNGGTWEGNVGPNGAQNRQVTLVSAQQTLPAVYFNNLAAIPTNIPITFQLDLSVPIAQGTFDPASGTASVAGDLLNNWNTTASMLTQSVTDSNLWTGTFEVSSTAGTAMQYKYVLNDTTWEGNVGPDGTANRAYTFPSTDPQTLPPVDFNNVNNLGPLALGTVSAGQLSLSWTAGPLIRLQMIPDLKGLVWQDVPNTQGQSNTVVTVGSVPAFFQLVGP